MASSDPAPAPASIKDHRLLLLRPEDNVVCVCANLAAGDTVSIDDGEITVPEDAAVGFKLARHDLAPGDKVLKYGAPIGSVTQPIAKGAVVHTHNLKSDYLPTYTLTGDTRFIEAAP
ncbi:MAG: UxaA family hydrolase [Pseudomonadota bacterium]